MALQANDLACENVGVAARDALATAFASKVIVHLRFGFAAGCEAWALPRRKGCLSSLGYALRAAFGPITPKG